VKRRHYIALAAFRFPSTRWKILAARHAFDITLLAGFEEQLHTRFGECTCVVRDIKAIYSVWYRRSSRHGAIRGVLPFREAEAEVEY
jgi:hypothetical protein